RARGEPAHAPEPALGRPNRQNHFITLERNFSHGDAQRRRHLVEYSCGAHSSPPRRLGWRRNHRNYDDDLCAPHNLRTALGRKSYSMVHPGLSWINPTTRRPRTAFEYFETSSSRLRRADTSNVATS